MAVKEIAQRLVALCRLGVYEQAHNELYSPDVVSIEPDHMPNNHLVGLAALKEKTRQFEAMVAEIFGREVSDPMVAGNFISFVFKFDFVMHGQSRMQMEEICVYEVRDGKIIGERFFY